LVLPSVDRLVQQSPDGALARDLDALQLELQRYGITPVPLMVFDWGGYRYSNARDAIAAAKRLGG
jgi:hypothetical protein